MPNRQNSLTKLNPSEALEMYLAEKQQEAAEATVYSHKSRLRHFIRYCEANIDHLSELTPKHIYEFRIQRAEEVSKVTLKTQLDTLRVFVRFCERIEAVEEDLSTKVAAPTLEQGEGQRSELIEAEVAEQILNHLSKYEYAEPRHVAIHLMWYCGLRIGAVHSLDTEDVDFEEMYLNVEHRPELDTTLKNKERGERLVAITDETCDLLEDYIEHSRPENTDEHGRNPLITTRQGGRPAKGTLRDWSYQLTRPCMIGDKQCPHGRDPEDCEATEHSHESKCPSSKSAHAWRRGAITQWLRDDTPMQVVSDRANVSEEVLSKHYDERSSKEKMEQRREFFS